MDYGEMKIWVKVERIIGVMNLMSEDVKWKLVNMKDI